MSSSSLGVIDRATAAHAIFDELLLLSIS